MPPARKRASKKFNTGPLPVDKWEWESTPVVGLVSEGLARRWHVCDLRVIIAKQAARSLKRPVGQVSDKIVHAILKAAREDLLKRLDLDRSYEKALAVSFYESIIRDPTSTLPERTRAQERIDSVLGLDAKFDQGKDGADQLAQKIRAALGLMSNLHE